ncbi:MAG: putative integral rane protein, partial [Acidimicrobiales bacterium]|nr:putative integral rane protein [Acidimicrobiales bacterium]
ITIGLAIVGDGLLPGSTPHQVDGPVWHQALVVALTAGVVVLSYRPARNLLSRHQAMNAAFDPLHLVNTYGAFGSITRVRQEVIVEGADDLDGPWLEYQFKGKPGDPMRRPRQVAPYHLRLDWLLWFLAISPAYGRDWFVPFVTRVLEGDADTLRLLGDNPFPDHPPAYARATMYRYRFTTGAERRATGAWWDRTREGELLRPVRLEDLR